jgi:hypothetical protein
LYDLSASERENLMRAIWTCFLATTLSAFVAACGGGGGAESHSGPVTNIADCFQVKLGNSFRYTGTASPSQAQTILIPGTYSTTTYYYENTVYKASLFKSLAVTSRSSIGTDTYTTTTTIPARPFIKDDFFTANSGSYTSLGEDEDYPTLPYISETTNSGRLIQLSWASGQPQNFSYTATKTATISGNTATVAAASYSNAFTYMGREDVITPAGTFKNSCKLNLDSKALSGVASATSAGTSGTVWYAPGWGLVKQASVETFTDGRQPATLNRTSVVTGVLAGTLL